VAIWSPAEAIEVSGKLIGRHAGQILTGLLVVSLYYNP